MALDGISLAEMDDRVSERAQQDQTARMCRLILVYTLRNINILSSTEDQGFTERFHM